MWQLFVHSLGLPRVLLEAYKVDGRADFLRAAADYLVAYDAYESSGWRPGGYLWNDNWGRFVRNDHAVSARVPVLVEFWRLYRRSPDYRPDVAKAVFRMAARCSYLLTHPSRFTFATNHGVMQNLATCQLSLSFPTSRVLRVTADWRSSGSTSSSRSSSMTRASSSSTRRGTNVRPRLIGIAFRYRTLLGVKDPRPLASEIPGGAAGLRRPPPP